MVEVDMDSHFIFYPTFTKVNPHTVQVGRIGFLDTFVQRSSTSAFCSLLDCTNSHNSPS